MVRSQNTVPRAIASLIILAVAVACQSGNTAIQPSPTPAPSPTLPAPTPSATSTPSKPPPPSDWTRRWLQGIPCRPPCWEGITPGRTTASEAVEILNSSPIVANVQKETRALMPELGDVFWNWVDGKDGGEANYPAKDPAEIIYRIRPIYYEYLQLQDVMQAYGEPSHIVAIAEHSPDTPQIFFGIWVIYLPQGIVLSASGRQKVELGDNTLLNQVVFLIPGWDGVKASVYPAKDHPDWVIPWQGFKDFEFYCHDIAGGKWCRGETEPR